MSPDTFLARALLASGMLTRAQLDIALKWLEESPQGGLGDLLCTNGVIPRAMYEALMRFYRKDSSRVAAPATGNRDRGVREAQLFCLIGIREKEITPEQLRDAVDQWVRLEGMGKPRPIGEVMMEKGYLDLTRMRSLGALAKESTLACGACGAVDSLYKVGGSPFSCESCKAPLGATRVKEGAAPAGPADPMAGKMVGGCRLDEKIGTGRWTVVYKGLIPAQNRTAAIRIFAPETPAGALDRYLTQALKATTFTHPSLVQVISAGKDDNRGWILMEHVEGRPPQPREKMPWNKLCKAAIELSRALSVIHANGFVHGDVRPQSVFLKEGGVKLGDFGQAHDSLLVAPGDPRVLAPELWKNEPSDSRADLYALGVTLYFLATGRYPFDMEDVRLLEIAHRSEAPKPPGAYNLELPRAVSAIIVKLLGKDPPSRYGFAEEVARDFEAVLRGETPTAAGGQEGQICGFCKTPNPATEKTCVVCGKPLKASADRILLDDEFLCPKCEKVISHTTVACECGYRPCVKCHQHEGDAETGYCSTCLTPEAAAELKRKKAGFRGPPKLVRPGAAGPSSTLKAAPPRAGGPASSPGLKPPPPAAASAKPASQAGALKPPPPAASKPPTLKPPPPSAKPAAPAEDELDFEALPPPDKKAQPAAAPAGDDDLDFDALPPPGKDEGGGDPLGPPEKKGPPPPAPPRPKTSLMDRRRR